ncbi:AraC family transcriptional regulator [Thalassotalea atypica]|uniref:AraC family transcriptional regulator n=1 Tax=Thalassotalea atypica TaxID=2054316 RepID=UPI002574110D|nr:AraC family transcriptional regulator [Thalassotalea atypica]
MADKLLAQHAVQIDEQLGQASVPAVSQYLQLATEQGIDIKKILDEIKLDETLLLDNNNHVTGLQFQQLISALISQSNDELFGLHTAKYVQPGSYSVLGYISMNCESLGQAITKIQPFEKLVGDMGTTSFETLGEQVKISWHCQFTEPQVKRHMIDNCLASWLTFARYLVSQDSNPSALRLMRKRPSLSQQNEYQALFNCPIEYGQDENAIIFDKTLLSLPLNKGDQQLLSTLEDHAQSLILNLNRETSFPEQLSAMIEQSLKMGQFHQQDIANSLGISTKTLQRRLAAQGLNFQSILDETRLKVVKQYLANQVLPLNHVSDALGFKEPRSFYRWFNKLTQMTPGEYRKTLTQ